MTSSLIKRYEYRTPVLNPVPANEGFARFLFEPAAGWSKRFLIPLKKPDLRRCFNFPVTAAYAKYASFLENFAPCISVFLSGIRF